MVETGSWFGARRNYSRQNLDLGVSSPRLNPLGPSLGLISLTWPGMVGGCCLVSETYLLGAPTSKTPLKGAGTKV